MTTLHPITVGRTSRGLSSPLPGQVYVGRPSPLGNPYQIGRNGTRKEVIAKYRAWLWRHIRRQSLQLIELQHLVELALAGPLELLCWCAPLPCHAEVIRDALIWLDSNEQAQAAPSPPPAK